MDAGSSKKSICQQSVSRADPDTSRCNEDDDDNYNDNDDNSDEDGDNGDHFDDDDLVDFLPTLEVLGANESMVVKQSLSDNGVGRVDHRVVNRSQALPVSIVWAAHRNW